MTTYCSPEDVKRALRLKTAFAGDTTPSIDEVSVTIEEIEDEIDLLTGHAWRTRQSGSQGGSDTTAQYEYHDIERHYLYHWDAGIKIKLLHRQVKTLSSSAGDKLEVWNGDSWEDWVSTKTEGRNNDYWLDNPQGELFIRQRYWPILKKAVRVKYRYGEANVPKDIRKATAFLTAAELILNDDYSSALQESAEAANTPFNTRSEWFEQRAGMILSRYVEFFVL